MSQYHETARAWKLRRRLERRRRRIFRRIREIRASARADFNRSLLELADALRFKPKRDRLFLTDN